MSKKYFFAVFFSCLIVMSACTKNKTVRSLFNGEDLDLWNTQGSVKVENGIVALDDNASLILKKDNFKNFELQLSVRMVNNGKGFVAFHTDKTGKGGYQIALNNDLQSPRWWTKTGSLLGVRNLTKSVVKNDEWFDMTIRVEGKTITVKLNDYPVVEYTEPAAPYRSPEHADQLLSHGNIYIKNTGGGGILELKTITITPLDISGLDIAQQQREKAVDETTDEIIRLHQSDFPVLDYHVHLKGELTRELAAEQSRKYAINYALAPNCGIGFPITTNEQVMAYLDSMKGWPFVQAMQGEGREWSSTFSKEVRDKFDFVFTDAMTFTDNKGRRTRLWIPEEVWIENEQQYMDLIVQKICEVMEEPMDVYVNPLFLPDQMNDRYDEFWTEERMNRVIDAMVEHRKALEINNRYRIPHKAFIEKAKAAGIKFTFGTNNTDADFGKLEYCIRMMKECGITAEDMFKPHIKE
jgi:hypothetical protein